jgi:hypothetical protein
MARVERRIQGAKDFVNSVVDPIIVLAVSHLIVEKPLDVLVALHAYLLSVEVTI